MEEFPTSEDEFDLMYGDDLEVLRDQEDPEKSPKKSRKSLDFASTANTKDAPSQDLFEDDFAPLEDDEGANVPSSVEPSNANKRTIEELFGDIDDILFENQTKKRRTEGENAEELALIEHIIELRRLAKERDAPDVVRRDYTGVHDRDKNNLSYTVPSYPFIGVTRDDGQRVYIRFHSEQYELEERQRIVQEISSKSDSASNQDLWAQAQELILKQVETQDEQFFNPTPDDKELWVDMYKPRKYFELLSDESTNRVMLRWLKLWDKVVFKRKPKIKPVKPNEKQPKNKIDLCTDLDEHGRPYHKVALLCGPPGLGKTTLAHMVARHAGYNVVEINASDDRSIDAFKTSIENATSMRSVLDTEKRPNCLIFDEIDGAPAASIDYLVKFVTGAATKTKKKSQLKEKNVLKRPIICICNDVYVPSLRPLRQVAFVVNFPPTSNTRLSERLMEISKWQRVKTDMGAMLALAEKSQNDIRSCLSVLHFFKAQDKPVTLSDVHKASVGKKDTQKGIFSVWQDIFLIERGKGGSKSGGLRERMGKILDGVNSFGDYEKVAQGVFENYPHMNFKSVDMSETCLALEWFSYSDMLNKEIYSSQNYELARYLQYAFVVWHFVFGSRTWQKLQYPSAGYEARMKQNRQKAIIGELMRGMQPSIRSYVDPSTLILDLIPMFMTILAPSFRPISLHLYTEEEKKVLDRVVNVMVDYNLNYVQERTAEGAYVYKLDPGIDEIASFAASRTLSYSNKQLIAQEIEAAKMRRFEAARPPPAPEQPPSASALPNHLQTLKAKSVAASTTPVSGQFSSSEARSRRSDVLTPGTGDLSSDEGGGGRDAVRPD
ncbi:hypothetical protein Zmor_024542 [Zophobas morio]|uniref:AAA+ ATPase domain-containing protein n=1 Tax=Zophobas morio TaxID=2755281 RepID=A0AA38M846_9CUCU|nr:hypothetical protein Zmor_024542 [Zophobas morio]